MAECIWCENKGLFLSVNEYGLCGSCNTIIISEGNSRLRVFNESSEVIEQSNNPDTIISRTKVARENLNYLLKYEKRGIPILTKKINVLISELYCLSNDRLLEIVTGKFQMANDKLKKTRKEKEMVRITEKFLHEADQIKDQLFNEAENYPTYISIIGRLSAEIESKKVIK